MCARSRSDLGGPPAVGAYVFTRTPPGAAAEGLHALMLELFDELGVMPTHMSHMKYETESRQRKFRVKAVADLLSKPETKSIWCVRNAEYIAGNDSRNGTVGDLGFSMDVAEHNRNKWSPYSVWFAFACEPGAERDIAMSASVGFLRSCATVLDVLHGGVMANTTWRRATADARCGGSGLSEQARSFGRRLSFEAGSTSSLWRKMRRLDPITLLGPNFVKVTGGARAALDAGAIDVEMVNGSLIVTASNHLYFDDDFFRSTPGLRQWLWPHTLQNPYYRYDEETLWPRLVTATTRLDDATKVTYLGCDAFAVGDQPFSVVWNEGRIAVRLPVDSDYEELMALSGSEPWVPVRKRPWPDWVLVPWRFHEDAALLEKWVERACTSAR